MAAKYVACAKPGVVLAGAGKGRRQTHQVNFQGRLRRSQPVFCLLIERGDSLRQGLM